MRSSIKEPRLHKSSSRMRKPSDCNNEQSTQSIKMHQWSEYIIKTNKTYFCIMKYVSKIFFLRHRKKLNDYKWKLIFTFSNSLIHCATQQMALSPLKAKTLISDVLCNEWWHCLSKALTQPSLAKRTQVAFPAWLLEFPMPASLPRAITLCSAERIPTSLLGWSISRTRG